MDLSGRLSELGYPTTFPPQAAPLVERLLHDLTWTADALAQSKSNLSQLTTAHQNLQASSAPLKKDLARKARETNALHAQIIAEREGHDLAVRDYELSVKKLEQECSESKFIVTQIRHKMRAVEKENEELKHRLSKVTNSNSKFQAPSIDLCPISNPKSKQGVKMEMPKEASVDTYTFDLLKMADAQIASLSSSVHDLERERADWAVEREDWRNKVDVRDKEIARLAASLEESIGQITHPALSHHEPSKKESTLVLGEFLGQIEYLTSQVEDKANAYKRLESEHKAVMRELGELRILLSSAESDKAESKSALDRAILRGDGLERKVREMKAQLAMAERQHGKQLDEIQELLASAEERGQELESMQSALQERLRLKEQEMRQQEDDFREREDSIRNMVDVMHQEREREKEKGSTKLPIRHHRSCQTVTASSSSSSSSEVSGHSHVVRVDAITLTDPLPPTSATSPSSTSPASASPKSTSQPPQTNVMSTETALRVLEQELADTEAELDRKTEALYNANRDLEIVRKSESLAHGQVQELTNALSQATTATRDAEARLSIANKKSEECVARLQSMEVSVEATRAQIAVLEATLAQTRAELTAVQTALATTRAKEEATSLELRECVRGKVAVEARLREKEEESADALLTLRGVQQALDSVRQEKRALEGVLVELRGGMEQGAMRQASMDRKLQEREVEVGRLLRDVRDYGMQCDALARACEGLQRQAEEASKRVTECEQREHHARLALLAREEEIGLLRRQLGVMQVEVAGARSRTDEEAKKAADAKRRLEVVQEEARQLENLVQMLRAREYQLQQQQQQQPSSSSS